MTSLYPALLLLFVKGSLDFILLLDLGDVDASDLSWRLRLCGDGPADTAGCAK